MSRCFGYPPPGYVLPDTKGPLIESIKLQKDKEKTKEERRKERKREKKDKKRKREEQSTPSVHGFDEGKLINEKSQKLEKQTSNLKGKYFHSRRDDESSDVTEERELPVCVAKPSYSSEDSQNSEKRRRHESPANTIHVSGSILKICLSSIKKGEISAVRDWPSFKKKDPNAARDLPSTSWTDPIGQYDFEFGQRLVEGQSCCASTSAEICAPRISPLEKRPSLLDSQISNKYVAVGKSSSRRESKVELLYKTLLETWVTPALGSEQGYDDDDELDWLFQRKLQNTEVSEMRSNAKCSLGSNLWPRAQILPSGNAYALPYTVPF